MSGPVFRHITPSDKWDIARNEHEKALRAAITDEGVFGPVRSDGGRIIWGPSNNDGICTFTICAHGSIALTEHTETRGMASMDEDSFDTSVFSQEGVTSRFHPVNLTVARVVDPSILVPGLSLPGLSPEGKRNVPTNFTLHLPNITNKIREFMSSQWSAASAASASASTASAPASAIDEKLMRLAEEIMNLMRVIDEASGIVYRKQETSNPGGLTTTEDHFYNVYKIDRINFLDALRRLLYIRPNIGEAVRPVSGLPKRQSSDGSHPFSYYGIFIFTADGGLLPQSCTLVNSLISKDNVELVVKSKPYTFQKYNNPEDVSKYNLADFENRLPIEIRIGVNMGYLEPDGSLSAVDDDAVERWQEFKHDPKGPIQTLRRAIINKLISHVGAALILSSLGYRNLLLVDTACNSIDVTQPPDPPVLDSQELLVRPIANRQLLFSDRQDIVIFDAAIELERQKALEQRREQQKQFVEDLRRKAFSKHDNPNGGSRKSTRSYSRKRRTRRKRCVTRRYRCRRK
jgi:hypothetical protein